MSEPYRFASRRRRLPSQPNIEQLRKQAKDLLAGFRVEDPGVVAEVRQFAPEALASTFALHDAQLVLARAYGYASWSKLKAFVDGANVEELAAFVQAGDVGKVRALLATRPELVHMDLSESNEHRALHFAVLRRDAALVKLLMEAGADARKGIYPHRDATSALRLALDRGYDEIVRVIEEEERLRREELSCPNATISPVQEQINAAIRSGDTRAAIELLSADPSVIQACDRTGGTALHVAAEEGDLALVAWLLEHRAKVQKRDLEDMTCLDRAVVAADPRRGETAQFAPVAQMLLAQGAEMTVRTAVALGDVDKLKALLERDAGVLRKTSARDGIVTSSGLLTVAVKFGQVAAARVLLDYGADVDEREYLEALEEPTLSWGKPLWWSALTNQYEMTELLLERGADPNANVYASGWPLRNAWNHPDQKIKQLLLARGARPQPYMLSEAHNVGAARELLAADASEELAVELGWSGAHFGCPAIVEMALTHLQHWAGDDPRWHWLLIQPMRGASSDAGRNAGQWESLALLLRRGASPNVARYGQTALHFTAAYGGEIGDADRGRFAELLIRHGARLDVRDELLRSTPLGWACRWGRVELARVLLAEGAPVVEPDAEAWATPMAWASKMKRAEILRMLTVRAGT